MILLELFNSNVSLEITRDWPEELEAQIEVTGRKIIFTAVKKNEGRWVVVFHEASKDGRRHFGITGSGGSIQVLKAAKEFISELIKKHNPNIIRFTAEEKNRASLYEKMLEKLTPSGYKFRVINKHRPDFRDNEIIIFEMHKSNFKESWFK